MTEQSMVERVTRALLDDARLSRGLDPDATGEAMTQHAQQMHRRQARMRTWFRIIDAVLLASLAAQAGWLLGSLYKAFASVALVGLVVIIVISLFGRNLDRAGYFEAAALGEK